MRHDPGVVSAGSRADRDLRRAGAPERSDDHPGVAAAAAERDHPVPGGDAVDGGGWCGLPGAVPFRLVVPQPEHDGGGGGQRSAGGSGGGAGLGPGGDGRSRPLQRGLRRHQARQRLHREPHAGRQLEQEVGLFQEWGSGPRAGSRTHLYRSAF